MRHRPNRGTGIHRRPLTFTAWLRRLLMWAFLVFIFSAVFTFVLSLLWPWPG